MTTIVETTDAPDDLFAMPGGESSELVERNVGIESSWIGGRLFRFLSNCVETIRSRAKNRGSAAS